MPQRRQPDSSPGQRQIRTWPERFSGINGRRINILPCRRAASDGMHLAGQAEGMAALGRLSLDETKVGGMRDRGHLLTANSKH